MRFEIERAPVGKTRRVSHQLDQCDFALVFVLKLNQVARERRVQIQHASFGKSHHQQRRDQRLGERRNIVDRIERRRYAFGLNYGQAEGVLGDDAQILTN